MASASTRPYLAAIERTTFISQHDHRPARQTSVASATAHTRYVDDIKKRLNAEAVCLRCGQGYVTKDNFIARDCDIHVRDTYLCPFKGYVYRCCGRVKGVRGCVSCMHVSDPNSLRYLMEAKDEAVVPLPKELVDDGTIACSKELIRDLRGEPHPKRDQKDSGKLFYIFPMMK